jgi:hypothetical protein
MDRKQGNEQNTVRIDLTEEQKRQIQQATGKNAQAIELSVNELEDRISPLARSGR